MAAVNDYIFLTQRDFLRQRSSNIQSLTTQKKADILRNMVKKYENRMAQFAGGDLTKARSVLNNEDLAKELNQKIDTNSAIGVAFPNSLEAAEQLFEEFKKEEFKAEDFCSKLDNFLSVIDNEYFGFGKSGGLKKEYYNQIKTNFIANRQLGRQIGEATPEERIYASIMDSKYQGKAFYLDKTQIGQQVSPEKLNSSIGKIYALKGLIDAGQVSGDNDFWLSVGKRTKKWMEDFLSSVAEVAIFQAYVKGESQFFKSLKGSINTRFFGQMVGGGTSGVSFSVRFSEDPTLSSMYERLAKLMGNGRAYSVKNRKTNKSDISLKINQNGVSGTAGISVKDYQTNDITDSSKPYNMHVQSNTPLLTFLLRECEFSTSELVTLMNIGAALYGSTIVGAHLGSMGDALSGQWEAIKENIKYRGILSVLAGLENTSDQIYYMALNGRIFTMSQVLQNIQENALKGNNVSIVHGINEGLNRGTFQRINRQNIVTSSRGQEAAWERSQNVEAQLMQHMYSSKVSISINLYNMAQYLT